MDCSLPRGVAGGNHWDFRVGLASIAGGHRGSPISTIIFFDTAFGDWYCAAMTTSGRWRSAAFVVTSPLMRKSRRYQSPQQVCYHVHIAPDQRYAYVSNPKVGTTSIKSLLIADALGLPDPVSGPVHDRLHDPFLAFESASHFRPLESLQRNGTKFVTIVRNPFARLLSAYQSKIVGADERNEFTPRAIDGWRPGHGVPTFESFVRSVCLQTDRRADPHWRQQTAQVLIDVLDFDFIGHLEHVDDDLPTMMQTVGVSVSGTPRRNATGATDAVRPQYSDELAELVFNRYRGDFQRFGYGESLEELAPIRRLSLPSRG
ncbi:MAG: hypothetical protein ACJA14_001963 [Ilumatobacter sp.]